MESPPGGTFMKKVSSKKVSSKRRFHQKEGSIKEGFIRSDERFIRSGRGGLGAETGVTESLNSTGFIRVFDMAQRRVIYSEKPNAFFDDFRVHIQEMAPK